MDVPRSHNGPDRGRPVTFVNSSPPQSWQHSLQAEGGLGSSMDRFVAKLRSRQQLSAEDEAALREAGWIERRYRRHETIIRAGEQLSEVRLLLSGFVARCHEDGTGQRQIVGISVAGDLLDTHAMVLGELGQDAMALGPCVVAGVAHGAARRLIETRPGVMRAFWLQAAIDSSLQAAWIQALGSKRGTAKIAHLFCEMQLRLGLVGLATDMGYPLPLNQQELADFAGMTHVHLNRCLRELREAGLVSFASGWARVLDFGRLKALAHFDDAYLHLQLQGGS